MKNNLNHSKSQPELNPEILKMISGTSIAWSKTKEEIWTEMLGKIESKKTVSGNNRTIYLQVAKYAAAAVVVVLLSISSLMYFYTKTITTQIAQESEVILPDNSKVTVYAKSIISYKPLLWKISRSVKFEGEGLFEVQKGEKFEVISRKGKTMVLGTQFNVYSRYNDYNVTCVSGKVKVIESANKNEVIITEGQKAILKPDGNLEIIDKPHPIPEAVNNTQKPSIEEELNTVLTTAPEPEQSVKIEEFKKSVDKQSIANEKDAEEIIQDKPIEPNVIKEQNRIQNQAVEAIQNNEQLKAPEQMQAGDKEQVRNQERTQGQATVNTPLKERFRASLTPEQVSILENQQMTREEKRTAFMQSLSTEQRQLLKEQNEERAKQTGPILNENMKDQQKSQMREQMREGSVKENKELQQIRENRRNAQPGGDNKNKTGKGN